MSETAYLSSVRASYDAVAVDCARLLGTALDGRPLDRALLAAFAESVRAGAPRGAAGPAVADLGCGPGRITAYLNRLGVRAFGVDLSPAMVAVARRSHPGLRFEVGAMGALDAADGGLGGAVAWNSTLHTPPEELPSLFGEFARVLAPGGHLLLAFGAGEGLVRLDRAYGHAVDLTVHRMQPDRVAELLSEAGLAESARLVRQPEAGEDCPQGFLLARKASPAARTPSGGSGPGPRP
ncbi:class I SAM-dependent DNA methyltransferase [Streptomyces globosus]|uniref:class I SAM-dependent DNA methyltransferase n=1 Tax=Streptomyces globosus TaxID=68209 RepID=UPI0038076C47